MSKFFLQSHKPKLLWQDHRVVTFKQFQKSLKKFKLFQIQKIIKKIKSKQGENPELQSKLEYYKRIPSSALTNLALFAVHQMKKDVTQIKQHLSKYITGSVEDIITAVEGQINQEDNQLSTFYRQFKTHPLYTQTTMLSTKTKKIQKKRNKTKQRELKKRQVSIDKAEQKQHVERSKSEGLEVKTRYERKIAANQKQVKFKKVQKPQVKKEEVKKQMHPSWQAKLEQNKTAVFAGKKISLI